MIVICDDRKLGRLQVPPGQKLAVMYVADSIIKNVDQKAKYRELFGKSIVKTFVHVFDTVRKIKGSYC